MTTEAPSLYGDVGRAAAAVVMAAERLDEQGRADEAARLLATATARLEVLLDDRFLDPAVTGQR